MPMASITVAISLTARLDTSPKQIIASKTVKTVLDLSMGTTLLISPIESASESPRLVRAGVGCCFPLSENR